MPSQPFKRQLNSTEMRHRRDKQQQKSSHLEDQ
jgi:hypothetical protein